MIVAALLIFGLVLLVVGGELLVRGAVQVASRLGVSPLIIGLTLVGFGTSTRERWGKTYISPAHLKDLYGQGSPAPDTYTLQSSLGRQVINSRVTYPARSFGIEDRFDADRRYRRAAVTPGPGAYRV